MDGADVWRTSSWASRHPPDVISAVAILDPRWRRRKWRHPGPGAGFSTPIEVEVENGGPSASGRHLGWPHLWEPEMKSSKMATGSGRAAIFHLHLNGGRKTRPILLTIRILKWHNFVQATTTELSWHVQESGLIGPCQSNWDQYISEYWFMN